MPVRMPDRRDALVIEPAWGPTPALEVAGTVNWVIFVLDFALKLALAPSSARPAGGGSDPLDVHTV